MKAKQLTENSYLLTSDLGNIVSLVFKRQESFISSHNTTRLYESLDEISSDFNEKCVFEKNEKESQEKLICGYPIKHDSFCEEKNDKILSYKIKESSNVTYAAGWWIIPHETGYRITLSPKVQTIMQNCTGPFKTKFAANAQMNYMLKNEKKD